MAIIDLGRVNLEPVVGMRRVVFEASAPSWTVPAGSCRADTEFVRPSSKISDFGLLLVPVADVVAVLLAVTAGPARMRAAAVSEAPGLGSLLGDVSRCASIPEEDADAMARLRLFSRVLFASSLLESSFLGTLPSPAVGWRRERVRFSPVAEDKDDMASVVQADFRRTVS